jgi:hypothetical protein
VHDENATSPAIVPTAIAIAFRRRSYESFDELVREVDISLRRSVGGRAQHYRLTARRMRRPSRQFAE